MRPPWPGAGAVRAECWGASVDPRPPTGPPDADTPPSANGAPPYSLPAPLRPRGGLPVAPTAPRIPRALRAFNGTPEPRPAAPPARPRGREARTIRDLLLDNPPVDETGLRAGLRSAWDRLRRGRGREDEED
jgi:hypothetical protein